MDAEIAKLLPMARQLARDFSNIPGLGYAEIEMQAQEALAAAGRQFDPNKGDFSAYARQAVRNALRSLYEKQVRHHHHHAYVLNQPDGMQSTETDLIQNTQDKNQESVGTQVSRSESLAALQRAMARLSERHRAVLTEIGLGRSYSEIGLQLGMSKQGVHKIATAAAQALRQQLESQGFGGLDSVGLLKSSNS